VKEVSHVSVKASSKAKSSLTASFAGQLAAAGSTVQWRGNLRRAHFIRPDMMQIKATQSSRG
jgi:hypothetical protein